MKKHTPKTVRGLAGNPVFYMVFERFCVLKKGHFGADLGTFQQAHVAKTIVLIMFLVDFRMLLFFFKNC